MPNWCQNRLHISGPLPEVARFVRENRGNPKQRLSFEKLLPTPDSLLETKAHHNSFEKGVDELLGKSKPTDWYTWRVRMWGTKWDLAKNDVFFSRTGDEVSYKFDTAWSPPIPWAVKVSKKYPKLTITLRFRECGANFSGTTVMENGETVEHNVGEASEVHPDDEFEDAF